MRQYSLCNAPSDSDKYQIAVLRDGEGRGGSKAIHDLVSQGDVLEISSPKNHFALAKHASHHLLFAGGIGITPILSMSEHLASSGAEFSVHYCSRSKEKAAFIQHLASAAYCARVDLHFDDGEVAQRLDIAAALRSTPEGTHVYVCGPRGFMDAVLGEARRLNYPEDQLHNEFFGAVAQSSDTDAAFSVRLASSGITVEVPPECTIIQALSKQGVEVLTSCEQGDCGTCATRVLEGEPDHRDSYLTDAEKAAGDQILPCCSRSKSPVLVLDL